jgi:hypothetical protein
MNSQSRLNLVLLLIPFLACEAKIQAATSYLLIQGPFGANSATETHTWKVIYNNGTLLTGLDLLEAVFGTPQPAGTYEDAFSSPATPRIYPYYTAGNVTQNAGFIDFSGSLFTESFTLHSMKVAQTTAYDPGWNYYVAGGYGANNLGDYDSGSWTYSSDGIGDRLLAGSSTVSFDGFVYGPTYPAEEIVDVNSKPIFPLNQNSNFASATVINLTGTVPEPGRIMLLSVGVFALILRRHRPQK